MLAFVLIASRDGRPVAPSLVASIDHVDLPELVFAPDQHLTWSNAAKTMHCIAWQAFTELGRIGSHWRLDYDTVTAFAGLPLRHDGGWDPSESWAAQLARDRESIESHGPNQLLTGPFALIHLTARGASSLIPDPRSGVSLYRAETDGALILSNRAGLAARVLARGEQEPPRDVAGVAGLVVTGIPTGPRTGFAGVTAVPMSTGFTFDVDGRASVVSAGQSGAPMCTPQQDLDEIEAQLRRDLRTIAATGFDRILLLVDNGPASRLALALIESEGLTGRFCTAPASSTGHPGDPFEFAFRVSGGLPFVDVHHLAQPSNMLHVSASGSPLDSPFWDAGPAGTGRSIDKIVRRQLERTILDVSYRAEVAELLTSAILDELAPGINTETLLSRFHTRQCARSMATLNEVAPIPVVQLFRRQYRADLLTQLLARVGRDAEDPIPISEPGPVQGRTTPAHLAALLKRYLDQPGNEVIGLIDPAFIESARTSSSGDAHRLQEMAALLIAAIWAAGDERPTRSRRPDTPADAPIYLPPEAIGQPEGKQEVKWFGVRWDTIPDPLAWAVELRAHGNRSPIRADARVCALIPHLHAERYLADAIDSLVRQTRPLQAIVVIDDGSAGAPVDIVRQFPGVTLLQSPESSGPFRLVQEVIANTDFDAYLFQDADDWSEPHRLEVLLAEAARTGAEVIGSQGMRLIDREHEVVSYEHPVDPTVALQQHPIGNPIHYPSSLMSRDLIGRLGGFATGFRFGADTELIRRASHVAKLRNAPHRLYNYRTRDDSLTNSPLTGIRSEARRLIWEAQHDRARSNAERAGNGLPPMLLPISVAPPIQLRHLAGPLLPGISWQRWPKSTAASIDGPELPDSLPGSAAHHDLESPPGPIFVIGAPRSGASLLVTALSQHSNIGAVHDAAWMVELSAALHATHRSAQPGAVHAQAAGMDVEEFVAQFGATINGLVVRGAQQGLTIDDARGESAIQVPQSTIRAQRWVSGADRLHEAAFPLHRLFPHARFIHILRDPDAVVESLSTDNSRLYRSRYLHFEWNQAYDLWMDAVQRCRQVELALGASHVIRIDRDALLDDPESSMSVLLEFLGEPFEPAVLRPFR